MDKETSSAQEILSARKKAVFSVKTLVFFVLAVMIIYFLVSNIDMKKTADALVKADLAFVILSAVIYTVSNFFKSLRFNILLKESAVPIPKMFAISAYQNFFNQIMPARTGELTFLYYTKVMANIRASASLHALLISRMMDLVVVCLFFIIALTLSYGKDLSAPLIIAASLMGACSLLFVFKLHWLVLIGKKTFLFFVSLLRLGKKPLIIKIDEKIDILLEEFAGINMKKRIPLAAAASLFVWLSLYVFSYTTILAFGIDIGFFTAVAGSTGAVLTNVLPINSFGSFGTMEAGWTGGFLFVGMSMQDAVTTGFGYHLINFFAALIVAVICFVFIKTAKKIKGSP